MKFPLATGLVKPLLKLPIFLSLLLPVYAAVQLAPVQLATVERRDIVETLSLTGSLTSPFSASLSPDVEGRLVDIRVDIGEHVNQGDMLFRLDDELASLELRQAVAAEHEAEADLANAMRRVKEVRALVKERSFPESEARSLESQVERFEAVLERRRAERAFAADPLRHHTLNAPFSGVVAARDADPGERVDANSSVLLLVAIDRLQLDLRIPQNYFRRINIGTPVSLRLDALPEQTFETSVSRIVPVSDPAARTFVVRAQLDNSARSLTPGMSLRAVLRIGTNRRAEVVPRDALIRYADGRTIVWVAVVDGDKNIVRERLVKTGLTFDDSVEILQGLAEGESVVVRGNEALREDQQVRLSSQ